MTLNSHGPEPKGIIGRVTGAMTGRVVETIDPNVVLEFVDVDAVLDRIDINRLLDRIDENRLLDRLDLNRLLERVDLDDLLQRVDVDELLRRVDVDGLLGRVDVDCVLAGVDLNQLLKRVDVNGLAERVNLNGMLERVDTNRLVESIDPDALLSRVDLDGLLARIDVNRLLAGVDLNRLLEPVDLNGLAGSLDLNQLLARVDVDQLLGSVDLNRLLARVDVNRLLDRVEVERLLLRVDLNLLLTTVDLDAALRSVDLEAVVRRSGVPEIVAASTTHVVKSALDLVRRQLAGLDALLARAADRVVRHRRGPMSDTPVLLRDERRPADRTRRTVTGRYAGAVSRGTAAVLDLAIIMASYAAAYAGLNLLFDVFFNSPFSDAPGWFSSVALAVWAFVYVYVGLSITGRTPGKSIVGLRVVRKDGAALPGRSAFIRTLVFPLNIVTLGIGFLPILVHHEHRALQDFIAGTAVVYDWGDRPAQLPGPLSDFLSRRHAWSDTEADEEADDALASTETT